MADSFSAAWVGSQALSAKLRQMQAEADRTPRLILAKSSAVVIHAAQENFEYSHAKGEPHVGGDKPNIVTGYLRRSIRNSGIVRLGFADYATKVGPTAVYGRAIELGLRNGAKYPFFGPAVESTHPELEAIQDEAWAEYLRH